MSAMTTGHDTQSLATEYLGLRLDNPFLPGASPLTDELDEVRRLEDAGAPAVQLRSLFEEQLVVVPDPASGRAGEQRLGPTERCPSGFGPHEYLEHVHRVKEAVSTPVLASLNGTTSGGWLEFAAAIEEAGADALELNVYDLATDFERDGAAIEKDTLDMVAAVRANVHIPLAVKLSPFYTAFANFAGRLEQVGAGGLVLFNRFYQPDIDIENVRVQPRLRLSDSSELNLRLRWLAVLAGRLSASLAVTGGVHTPEDAVKALLCGADAVQVVSSIYRHGPEHLATLRAGVRRWMAEHDYASLAEFRGAASLERCPDPHAYERANYRLLVGGWLTDPLGR